MRKTVIFLMGLMTAIIFAVPVSAALYKYIDNRGIVRYTDNIETVPERYRSQITSPAPAVPKAPALEPPTVKPPTVEPPTVEPPTVEPPAEVVAAPEPGPYIEEAVAEPEVVTPVPTQPSVAVTEPEPYAEETVREETAIAPPRVEPAIDREEPPKPHRISTDTEEVRQEDPTIEMTAAHEPEPASLPEPEPYIEATVTEEVAAVPPPVEPVADSTAPPAPVETAYLIPAHKPEHPVDADITLLLEERKTLLGKKETLDKIFLSLAAERKTLEVSRAGMRDEQSIQKYNKNVLRLNERIQRFKKEETALRDEIERYNAMITKKQ